MTTKQAIEILKRQRDKLDDKNLPNDDTWVFQTASFVKDFFGEDSTEYNWISQFEFRTLVSSYWSDEQRRAAINDKPRQAKQFLNDCIDTIKIKGPYKPPKTNFLNAISDTALWTLIPLIGTILFSSGFFIGQYSTDLKNIELRQDLKHLKDSLSATIPSLPDTNPIADSITNKTGDTKQIK
jgi:hypothetical protein